MIYTVKAHPTLYKGTMFRSRLEARYAAYFETHHPATDAALLRGAVFTESQRRRKDKALALLKQVRFIAKEMLDEDIHKAEVSVNGNYFDTYLFTLEADAAMILDRVHSIRRLEWGTS
jgi:hypothetical protein